MKTTIALAISLFIASAALSAQEKKQVEKTITLVTVDENGVKKDTTIVRTDTLEFEGENLVILTREGRRIIHRPGKESRMIYIDTDKDVTGPVPVQEMNRERRMGPGMGMRPEWTMNPGLRENEGVNYHLSVDGVVVNIMAPKEKAAEADRILKEVQKILMK